jgi:hypothetical protein
MLLSLGPLVTACNGTTGDALIAFDASAAGAPDAGDSFLVPGTEEIPAYTVQLTFAQMYIGAVYVNEAPGGSGATFDTPSCIDTGVYCAQVPGGIEGTPDNPNELNLLSTAPQPFSVQGNGSADLGLSWEIYLSQGDVNNLGNNSGFGIPNIVDLQGTATREPDGRVVSWAATVNINESNRGKPVIEAGQPGKLPICMERILELGGVSLQLYPGASMLLTVDPRAWFNTPIDFAALPSVAADQCQYDQQTSIYGGADYCIPDSSTLPGSEKGATQGNTLYTGVTNGGAYTLTYPPSP